ncbi:MAG: hypothetical protein AB1813_19115 [Verrucomicrobiota bacterium]
MKTIFSCENELGRCEFDWTGDHTFKFDLPAHATIVAQTVATLTESGRILRIEQRCFLRDVDALIPSPWHKPELSLEPALGTQDETLELARQLHEQFCIKSRLALPEDCLVHCPTEL